MRLVLIIATLSQDMLVLPVFSHLPQVMRHYVVFVVHHHLSLIRRHTIHSVVVIVSICAHPQVRIILAHAVGIFVKGRNRGVVIASITCTEFLREPVSYSTDRTVLPIAC